MKRILIVASELPPGGSGIGNAVVAIKNAMPQELINIQILAPSGGDINIGASKGSGLMALLPFWHKTLKFIKNNEQNYDVIWLHCPMFLKKIKLHHAKLMISIHTTYNGFYTAYKKERYYRLLPYYWIAKIIEHKMFSNISTLTNLTVTAVSESVAYETKENGLNIPITIIPNGIKISSVKLSKSIALEYINRQYKLNLSKEDIILLYLGRLTEQKCPFTLLNYFKELTKIAPNLHLLVCGRGNLSSIFSERAQKEKNINLLGYVASEDLPLLMNVSDAFISMSCYEGLPLTVLEASAHNIPLVLSNIPPHEELVHSHISRGILVNKEFPSVRAVLTFIKESKPQNDIDYSIIQQQFSWDSIVKRYLNVLENNDLKK